MRHVFRWLLGSALLVSTGCAPALPAHLETLRDLERDTPLSAIEYRHRPTEVVIPDEPGEQGVARADCSGLINEVLKHTEHLDDAGLHDWLGRARPVAATYAAAIRDQNGFQRIRSIGDAKVGDFIAISYEEGANNTGHVMVMNSTARKSPSINVAGASYEWRCEVIDSSATGHGDGDSRFEQGRRIRAGLGHGVFRIFTDASGVPVAYAFTVSADSKLRWMNERPLYIGRLNR
jgi:hypothetical protein